MSENCAEREVRSLLVEIGMGVERIAATQHEPRADYVASDSHSRYIIEVKGRDEDRLYQNDLATKEFAFREEYLGRTNPVSRQIREGAEQLACTPDIGTPFQVLALVTSANQSDAQAQQFHATLYGTSFIITPGSGSSGIATPCFYFSFSEFYRLRHVDAALVLTLGGARLLVNDLADRAGEFRSSDLYKFFDQHGALEDPPRSEADGTAFIADCELDRRDEVVMLSYVKEKYRLEHAIATNPTLYTAGTVIHHPQS